jgi:hypothetical protein
MSKEPFDDKPAAVSAAERSEDDGPSPTRSEGHFETTDDLRTVDKVAGGRDAALVELPLDEQKRIISKLDWTILPLLSFLYLISFVDRSNSTDHQPPLSSPLLLGCINVLTETTQSEMPRWRA